MIKKGEIWIASLDTKKGVEVGKQRPVLIVQSDFLNEVGHSTVVVLPITSQPQEENVLRFKIVKNFLNKKIGFVLVDQLRALDVQYRLKKSIGKVSDSEMSQIDLLIKQVLDLG